MDPLTRYKVAVDDLNEHRNARAARAAEDAHFDCLSYVWLSSWWVRWYREWKLNRIMRRHVPLGNMVWNNPLERSEYSSTYIQGRFWGEYRQQPHPNMWNPALPRSAGGYSRAECKICGHLKSEMGNVLDKVRDGAKYVHRRYGFLT